MEKIKPSLENIEACFPSHFTEEQKAVAKTLFYKNLSVKAHAYYGGKVQTAPKAPVPGFNWFNVWYTPGVSKVSTSIRDQNELSYSLSNRSNLVAVVSDSTRVLGDGDCTPSGGLGVMEGKAFLMKYLGGMDAVALCIDSRDKDGENDPEKIIGFVKMLQPSFGAVNLEDISQPNCYRVLDVLREECDIPVWHDDAQGTASVTLAGVINALRLVDKPLEKAKFVFLGAGASNASIARIIFTAGADPLKSVVFDSKGTLHRYRKDIEADTRYYRKWELCQQTNPNIIETIEDAMKGADVLIALSQPGPDVVKQSWIRLMAEKPIVFACSNPVPEIYPHQAKEAGAYIVATGRGDFPNQVNNSIGFPGILKGALLVKAKKITDSMAIAAAYSLADFARDQGIHPDRIVCTMEDTEVFAKEAADVAMQAIKDGVAREQKSWQEVFDEAYADIMSSRKMFELMEHTGLVPPPPVEMIEDAFNEALSAVKT